MSKSVKYKYEKKNIGNVVTTYVRNRTGSFVYRNPNPKLKKKQVLVIRVNGTELKLNGRAINSLRKVLSA